MDEKKKKKRGERLRSKYRLVIMDDNTFEEKASFRLSRLNVYVLGSSLFVLQLLILVSLVIFTPVKEYIPGYTDVNMRRDLTLLKLKADSLESIIYNRDLYIDNIKNVISGNVDTINQFDNKLSAAIDSGKLVNITPEDSQLREEVETQDNYRLLEIKNKKFTEHLEDVQYFTPIKGFITRKYDPKTDHYGVDIVAPDNEPVKAVLDGTIVFASWTLETGYITAIQHKNNLITLYKHNSLLLKKVGNFVKAGDVIAIIGSTGELTTGPHLHFELWKNGLAVNPEDFIVF